MCCVAFHHNVCRQITVTADHLFGLKIFTTSPLTILYYSPNWSFVLSNIRNYSSYQTAPLPSKPFSQPSPPSTNQNFISPFFEIIFLVLTSEDTLFYLTWWSPVPPMLPQWQDFILLPEVLSDGPSQEKWLLFNHLIETMTSMGKTEGEGCFPRYPSL